MKKSFIEQDNLALEITQKEAKRIMENESETDPMNSVDLLFTQTDYAVETDSFVLQKVTKFEGIII